MGAAVEYFSGKLIKSKFPYCQYFVKKKIRACVIFFGLLKFVCYLPFGLAM